MTWKDKIKKAEYEPKGDGTEDGQKEEERKYKIIAPLLEKIEAYMENNGVNDISEAREAFEQLEFHLMTDIGYTGKYENEDATPMEDAMYREKERQGNYYGNM